MNPKKNTKQKSKCRQNWRAGMQKSNRSKPIVIEFQNHAFYELAFSCRNEVPQDYHKTHHCNNPWEDIYQRATYILAILLTEVGGSWFHTSEKWHQSWKAGQHFQPDQILISSQLHLWVTKQEEFVLHGSLQWGTLVPKASPQRIRQLLHLLKKALAIRLAVVFSVSAYFKSTYGYIKTHPIESNAYKTRASLSPSLKYS